MRELGLTQRDLGNYAKSVEYLEQAIAINEEPGNDLGIANVLTTLGIVYKRQGDFPRSLVCHEQALGVFKAPGAKHGLAKTLLNIGTIPNFLILQTS